MTLGRSDARTLRRCVTDVNLNAPVQRPSLRRVVARLRMRSAPAAREDGLGEHAVIDEVRAYGIGAALREVDVGQLRPRAVGETLDVDLLVRISAEVRGEIAQRI